MMNMHKKYPEYCFNEHKGYGTKKHFEKIIEHGFYAISTEKTFAGMWEVLRRNDNCV